MEHTTDPHASPNNETLPAQYTPEALADRAVRKNSPHIETREKINFWRDPALENLELLRATYLTHSFAPHTHDGYAIGVIDKGAERFKYRKQMYVAPAGCVVVINPGEMHTGEAAAQHGWSYRMLYPNLSLLQKAASELTDNTQIVPFFPEPVIDDPLMVQLLSRLHTVLATSTSDLERESALIWTLAHLVKRHADTPLTILKASHEYAPILRVRAYLEEHFTQNIALEELASLVHLSPFYLLRAFREAVGLPPHSYLTQFRVARAKHLISASVPLAEVAMSVGFSDQSHLNRHFKALVGVTPGQYARGIR